MSDLLIKNINMPKSCLGELTGKNDCPIVGICPVFLKTPFEVKEKECWNRRLDGCLLVEVKPHGELIERDKILEYIEDHETLNIGTLYDVIQDAPTVLEASE